MWDMELLLTVCVLGFCEYIAPPVTYATEESCEIQSALMAGMVAQHYRRGAQVTYRFRCQPAGVPDEESAWVEVTLKAEL